ncbi:MAG: hypothetical protein WAV32_03925 [Halobacteriota archaeon]
MAEEKIDRKVKDRVVKQAYEQLREYGTKGFGPIKSSKSLVDWLEKQEGVDKVSVYKDMDITVEFKDKTRVGILLGRDKLYGGGVGEREIERIKRVPISKRFIRPCWGWRAGDTPSSKKAGVLDPLYDDWPPKSTPDDICALLDGAGYEVEFVSGDDVNLNFFSGLDKKQYGVIFIRTHGGMLFVEGDLKLHIMARPFFDEYPPDSGFDGIGVFSVGTSWGPKYAYAFNNEFVLKYMSTKKFQDSIFHLLVCHGGDPEAVDDMINTFRTRGVGCYTGWTKNASSTYGDPAAVQFFEVLCDTSGSPNDVDDAIDEITAAGRSPDPDTGAVLKAYGKGNMQLRKSLCIELPIAKEQIEMIKKFPQEMIELRVALPEVVIASVIPGPDGRPDGGMLLPELKNGRRIYVSDKSKKF